MLSALAAVSAIALSAPTSISQRLGAVTLELVMDGRFVGWAKQVPSPSKDMVLKGKKILQNFTGGAPDGGQIPMEEMTLMAPEWYTWTHTCMKGDFSRGIRDSRPKRLYDSSDPRKDITINVYDQAGRLTSSRTLKNAYVTAVKFPTLDASSKDPVSFQFNLATDEEIAVEKPPAQRAGVVPKTRHWVAGNFNFELGNLPCKKVMKVDAITIKQTTASADASRIGTVRSAGKADAPVTLTTLRVTIDQSDSAAWVRWANEAATGDAEPKEGTITLLGPDDGTQAMHIEMKKVMVTSFSFGGSSAAEGGRALTVTLQANEMDYQFVRR